MQLNVHMQYSVDTVTYSNALNPLVNVIKNSTTDSVVVFTTLPSTAQSMEAKLCEKLNKAQCNVDVVIVTGRLPKMEKFFNMRLFSAKMECEFFCPRALVCNSAGNTGIDSPTVKAMVRAGFGTNLSTVFQERGRCARGEDMRGSISYVCTIKSLLENLHLLNELGPRDESNTAATEKHLTWDEHAIEEHDLLRGTRMKIDEPDTPYTHYDHHSDEESTSSEHHPRSPDENQPHHVENSLANQWNDISHPSFKLWQI